MGERALPSILRPSECELILVAERSGTLPEQWARIAELRRSRLEERIASIASTLEPFLVLGVGLLVGGVILALYLPTFRVLELL